MPAIYYFSLKDYCNDNVYDGKLYEKMSTHYASLETGIKRWERFRNTIDKFRKEGFSQDYNIKVDENYILIDGLHRLVMAKYFGKHELFCDVYHCDEEYYSSKGMGGEIRINEEELERYFDDDEVVYIKRADVELRK